MSTTKRTPAAETTTLKQRIDAYQITQVFAARFASFLALYNSLNYTDLGLEEGMLNGEVMELYFATTHLLTTKTPPTPKLTLVVPQSQAKTYARGKSTRSISYDHFLAESGTDVAHTIYALLKKSEPLSRQEIAVSLGIRMSTVCGQIVPLIAAGLVAVVGTKTDENSKRTVETLTAI